MERRMLLAVVLSFLVVMLWSSATGQCTMREPEKKDQPPGEEPAEPAPQAPAATPPETPGAPGPSEPPPPPPVPEEAEDGPHADYVPEEPFVTLRGPELEVTFTSQGAAIHAVRLRRAFEADKETPLDLVVPLDPTMLMGQIDDTYVVPREEMPGPYDRLEDPVGPMRRLHWKRGEAERRAEAEIEAPNVVYTFETASGAVWTKRWVLPTVKDRFDVRLWLSVRAPQAGPAAAVKVLACSGLFREPSSGAAFLYPNQALYRLGGMDAPAKGPWGLEVVDGADIESLRMLGAMTHYFLAGYYSERHRERAPTPVRIWATGEETARRSAMEKGLVEWFRSARGRDAARDPELMARIKAGVDGTHHAWLVVEVPTQPDAGAVELPFYVGPIEREVLRGEAYTAMEPVIEYPAAFDILADGLLAIYDLFRRLLGNAGLGVVFMTLAVRGLMMPISVRNQLSMRKYGRKIQRLKPKLEALKKKFGSNLKRLREEQAKLYREHGVGFPMGCLMMLIQIPIFFALFSCLRMEYTLRNSAFLWIQDLSGPDRLVDLGVTLNLFVVQVFSINALPLLLVALSIWQQRLMPKPADEQQAQQMKMMKWLPIIFAVILYNYTAALALYMVLSSAVAIVESRIVRARDDAEPTAAPA